jgi:uncharacterized membrane protein YccC
VRRGAQRWMQSRAWLRRHKARLGLFFRVTASALLSFALANWLELRLPLWAVVTAIIVTQMSVGQSLKATMDYLAGTIGGAIYGAVVGVLVGHDSEAALLAGLAIAVGPLALIGAIRQSLTAAPITAAIVLLVPTMTHATAIASAVDRVLEVAVGAVIGLAISFLLFPSSAYGLAIEAAARTLERLADALGELMRGLKVGLDLAALHRIQDGIGEGLMQLNVVCAEAERERAARVSSAPDTGPLVRTLLRLRHDLVIIGRAALSPLPEALRARLEEPADVAAAAIGDFLRASGAALLARRRPPSLDGIEAALDSYAAATATVRGDGLTRCLPSEVTERFFALCFALEQMRHDLRDLHRCVAEWAQDPGNDPAASESGESDESAAHAARDRRQASLSQSAGSFVVGLPESDPRPMDGGKGRQRDRSGLSVSPHPAMAASTNSERRTVVSKTFWRSSTWWRPEA